MPTSKYKVLTTLHQNANQQMCCHVITHTSLIRSSCHLVRGVWPKNDPINNQVKRVDPLPNYWWIQ